MKSPWIALSSVLIAASACAAPLLPTVEPYLPEQSAGILMVHLDPGARDTLASFLPADPALVKKVLDEHFLAFAQDTGIKLPEVTSVFGGFSVAGRPGGVVGIRVPLDLAKIAKVLKSSIKDGTVKEQPDEVRLQKGLATVVFRKEGLVLFGPTDKLEPVLKRKGGSPGNAALVGAAKTRAADASSIFVLANVPAGSLQPLPDHPVIKAIGADPQLTVHLTGLTLSSNETALTLSTEFDDASFATKMVGVYSTILKAWRTKVDDDYAAAARKTDKLGPLAPFAPETISARMASEMAAWIAQTVTAKSDGKLATLTIPREVLRNFKGVATVAILGLTASLTAAPQLTK